MKHHALYSRTAAALFAAIPQTAWPGDASAPPTLPDAATSVVVVSGSRIPHASFDLPAAVDAIDAERIGAAQPRVNLSESLAAVPGLVVQNRQNYAQDLQISSRGFGARSTFGVRGLKLIADGIPASMPDGQGQAATFDLDVAGRIEVLRGPYSALYGNHAGGVVQLFTREPGTVPSVELNVASGSDGMRKTDVNADGRQGGFDWLVDGSHFETDGYRAHSAANRDQAYAKLGFDVSPTGRLTIVAGVLRQDGTQDPLGVTWDTWRRDPRAGEPDATDTSVPQRTLSERYATRKNIHHLQLGLRWDQRLGSDRLHLTLYGGERRVSQYQAFSKNFQASPAHAGGVVDIDRDFQGLDANWLAMGSLGGGVLRTTVGLEAGEAHDARQGFENFVGEQLGVKGRLRRDEAGRIRSLAPYLHLEWELGRWMLTGGLRHSWVAFGVEDHYLSNGNDSGSVRYRHTTPLVALLYKATPVLSLYASAAQGFETPTMNELFYSSTGAGFNFGLQAATSTQLEAGAKAVLGSEMRFNAALFRIRTRDELVVDTAIGGRTSYRNASATLRQGLELALDARLQPGLTMRLAATGLHAAFAQASRGVAEGNRLPGVPKASLYGELAWQDATARFGAAIETIANGRIHPDDANAAPPAPGYGIVNARIQATQKLMGWRLREYVRADNLFGRTYIGSLIIGDGNKRYYEAAPGRNWVLGGSARFQF